MPFAAGLLVKFFGLFGLKIGPTLAKIILILAIIGAVVGGFYWFRAEIKQEVYNEFYAEQVEIEKAEQQKKIEILENTVKLQRQALDKAMKERQEIAKNFNAIVERSKKSGAMDGDIAPVLKEALDEIRKLKEGKAGGKP